MNVSVPKVTPRRLPQRKPKAEPIALEDKPEQKEGAEVPKSPRLEPRQLSPRANSPLARRSKSHEPPAPVTVKKKAPQRKPVVLVESAKPEPISPSVPGMVVVKARKLPQRIKLKTGGSSPPPKTSPKTSPKARKTPSPVEPEECCVCFTEVKPDEFTACCSKPLCITCRKGLRTADCPNCRRKLELTPLQIAEQADKQRKEKEEEQTRNFLIQRMAHRGFPIENLYGLTIDEIYANYPHYFIF